MSFFFFYVIVLKHVVLVRKVVSAYNLSTGRAEEDRHSLKVEPSLVYTVLLGSEGSVSETKTKIPKLLFGSCKTFFFFFHREQTGRTPACVIIDFPALSTRPWSAFFSVLSVNLKCHRKRSQVTDVTVYD